MEKNKLIKWYLSNIIKTESLYENNYYEFFDYFSKNINYEKDFGIIFDFAYDIWKFENINNIKSYLTIRLLRDLNLENFKEYLNMYKNHKINEFIFNYASSYTYMTDKNNDILKYLLLFIKESDSKYGIDEYGKQTLFKMNYLRLKEKNIKFDDCINNNIYLKKSICEDISVPNINKSTFYNQFEIKSIEEFNYAFNNNYIKLKYEFLNYLWQIESYSSKENLIFNNVKRELKYWINYYLNQELIYNLFKNKSNDISLKLTNEKEFIEGFNLDFKQLKEKNISFNKFLEKIIFNSKEEIIIKNYNIYKNKQLELNSKSKKTNIELLWEKIQNLELENCNLNSKIQLQNSKLDELNLKNNYLDENYKNLKFDLENEKKSNLLLSQKLNEELENYALKESLLVQKYTKLKLKESEIPENLNIEDDEEDEQINIIENTTVKRLGKLMNNLKQSIREESNILKNISSINISKQNSFDSQNEILMENNLKSIKSINVKKLSRINFSTLKSNKCERSPIILNFNKSRYLHSNRSMKNPFNSNFSPIKIYLKRLNNDNGTIYFNLIIKNSDIDNSINDLKIKKIVSNSFILNIENFTIKNIIKEHVVKCNLRYVKFPIKPINLNFSFIYKNTLINKNFEILFKFNELINFETNYSSNPLRYSFKTRFPINYKKLTQDSHILNLFKNINFKDRNTVKTYYGKFRYNYNIYELLIEIEEDNAKIEFGYNELEDSNYKDIYENILDYLN